MDARSKRPTGQDLLDQRHAAWLSTVRKQYNSGPVVIKLDSYPNGKTAMVLSEREIEVLQLISFGYSSRQIADKMFLSTHTITNHRKNMLSRSRCGNFAELVRVAISENLL